MNVRMRITEKFELSGGVTVLICKDCESNINVVGKQFSLVSGGNLRQTLTIIGKRSILNQKSKFDQVAFETKDTVELSQKEAQSGEWQLVGD
ncbi:hypothetical protein [Rheinheimera sp. EpRS3]|uniref:hypothetical protein n=1 Tax=Rheinheimera sp. EpRS3 TaxID=1712383 RepID=UPI0007495F9A|nr:hypothetical protein [Rheinheimera sp. EpRS3]KUM52373.1 hypothetical protein AR688_08710 [Rheinheimera sp. EpRS3]